MDDKPKLDRLTHHTRTVEEFLEKIARSDSNFRRAVGPPESRGSSGHEQRRDRPKFVQPIPPFRGTVTRMREVAALELLLNKRTKNNVLVCGAAGSGKTALVEALSTLRPHLGPFWRVDAGALVSGTRNRGDLEERLTELFSFVTNTKSTVFIDEIHALARMGVAEGSVGALDVMKPHLVDPDFRVVGATTLDEARFIVADSAFHRRFTVLSLPELAVDQLQAIYEGCIAESALLRPLVSSFSGVMSLLETLTIPASRVDAMLDLLEHADAYLTISTDAPKDPEELLRVVFASYTEFQTLPGGTGIAIERR
ncbi:AAA family ATPase [Microbacterium sp. Bi128]|uniref:AAA family ATPase n=1 Tax=Microbacterium sp. Bi128 TaxID=2821115 RepID=UPI001E45F08F|nr:AAA family ATPase [Microbacterium sp. Bi128]